LVDIDFNVVELLGPALVVHAEGFGYTLAGEMLKAGFDDGEGCAGCGGGELELDEGGGFLRLVL